MPGRSRSGSGKQTLGATAKVAKKMIRLCFGSRIAGNPGDVGSRRVDSDAYRAGKCLSLMTACFRTMKKRRRPIVVSRKRHLQWIVLLLIVTFFLGLLFRRWGHVSSLDPFRSNAVSVQHAGSVNARSGQPNSSMGSGIPHSQKLSVHTTHREFPSSVSSSPTSSVARIGHLERPACDGDRFLVVNDEGRYSLWYDTMYRQAAWVAYVLTRNDVRATGVKRENRFRRDPEILRRGWPSASDADYAGSSFDRGHLLPSADRRGSRSENRTTFYFSNISPQYPALNRGVWKNLEEQVRRWAECYDSLYVVTGPELPPGLDRRPGGVGIPRHYFKALLVFRKGQCEAVAFRLPNAPQIKGHFRDYCLSVDELESVSGYDFFPGLPDSLERQVESRVDTLFWQ